MIPRAALARFLSRRITNPGPLRQQPQLRVFSTTPVQHFTHSHPPQSSTPMAVPMDTSATESATETQITPESLTATLKSKLAATYVSVQDMSGGCGQAFNAVIVSPEF